MEYQKILNLLNDSPYMMKYMMNHEYHMVMIISIMIIIIMKMMIKIITLNLKLQWRDQVYVIIVMDIYFL